jgi:hypothetical protein
VERARFTLYPASEKGFQRLVEGGSSMRKPPERGDKNTGFCISFKIFFLLLGDINNNHKKRVI